MNPTDSYDDLKIENENLGDTENPTANENPGEAENPAENDNPGEAENPAENDNPGEAENPAENDNPGEAENPGENETPEDATDPMQVILDGIRLSLGEKEEDVDSLIESVRSLVDVMSIDVYQQRDVYIPPEILIEGYKAWNYPITVDYRISIVGYEEMVPQSATYDDHEQFLEDFQDMAWNCFQGTVFKDFYIDKVYDADGNKVFDSQPGSEEPVPEDPTPEEPVEDLNPAVLEVLQSIDSRLEIMGADLSTVSENSIAYYNDMRIMQEQNNTLQFHLLVTSIGLGFTVFLLLGYIIAHGFWHRMRAG